MNITSFSSFFNQNFFYENWNKINHNDNFHQSGVSTNQTRGGGAQADKTVFVATGRLATPQVSIVIIVIIVILLPPKYLLSSLSSCYFSSTNVITVIIVILLLLKKLLSSLSPLSLFSSCLATHQVTFGIAVIIVK